jgi:hypothetical protein
MTECIQSSFGFEASGKREIVARFDGVDLQPERSIFSSYWSPFGVHFPDSKKTPSVELFFSRRGRRDLFFGGSFFFFTNFEGGLTPASEASPLKPVAADSLSSAVSFRFAK